MAKTPAKFSRGDWVVHNFYGVGQIKRVTKKFLDGKKSSYFEVETRDSQYWIPVGEEHNDRLRPLASKSQLRRAAQILKRRPREMVDDHNKRKRNIREARVQGTLTVIARTVRDLYARQAHHKKLNSVEEEALRRLKDHFVHEWAACKDIEVEKARQEVNTALQESLTKVA